MDTVPIKAAPFIPESISRKSREYAETNKTTDGQFLLDSDLDSFKILN